MKKYFTAYVLAKGESEEKLFLCTRDVKVGDTVYDYRGKKETHLVTTDNLKDMLGWRKGWKPVAPISQGAKWVTHAMDFSEEEILIETGAFETTVVKIRCNNCKTFH